MDISEVSRRAGLPSSTVRFYANKGLITAIGAAGERRRFTPGVLDQLALIALGRAGGLSLDEIAAMLPADGAPRVDRRRLLEKADEIDATVKRLKAMSQGLRHAAQCPAPSHMQCPKFRQLLKAAAAGRLKPPTAEPAQAIQRFSAGPDSPASGARGD
jgi:DNA-binding transcriptional MerR regulator